MRNTCFFCNFSRGLVRADAFLHSIHSFYIIFFSNSDSDGTEVSHFHPTLLGSAILASSLSPDEGLAVFSELQKARRAFALDTDLHIIYLVS